LTKGAKVAEGYSDSKTAAPLVARCMRPRTAASRTARRRPTALRAVSGRRESRGTRLRIVPLERHGVHSWC
jgi:hypothetical protein